MRLFALIVGSLFAIFGIALVAVRSEPSHHIAISIAILAAALVYAATFKRERGEVEVPKSMDTGEATERLRMAMNYLQYENTVYWTRNTFFLAAQALAFSGYLASKANTADVITLVMLVFGLTSAATWCVVLQYGNDWIDKAHQDVTRLEERAYGGKWFFQTRWRLGGIKTALAVVPILAILCWLVLLATAVWPPSPGGAN